MTKPGPRLTEEQRLQVKEWIAAGYTDGMIQSRLKKRRWPVIALQSINEHRAEFREELAALKAARLAGALNTGLARWQERVVRLCEHADELDELMWVAGDNGKLYNEKAWRETLDDIAKETGGRRTGVDMRHSFADMTDDELERYISSTESEIAAGSEGGTSAAAADADTGA